MFRHLSEPHSQPKQGIRHSTQHVAACAREGPSQHATFPDTCAGSYKSYAQHIVTSIYSIIIVALQVSGLRTKALATA